MRNNVLVRLIAFYMLAIAFFAILFALFPQIPEYLAVERARQGRTVSLDFEAEHDEPLRVVGVDALFDAPRTVPIIVSLLLALATTWPVAWVYRWTRPRKRYSQAFAHTLLVVPIAITLVVFLVKGSLALAFSLAGIVAAVRFRTSLNEPMDAVYMFIVIGIGLAAGVQLLVVAVFASIFFNFVALTVWRMDFGAAPAVLQGWRELPPDEAGQLLGVSGVMQPDHPEISGEAKKPYNAKLRIQTTNAATAQKSAIPVLDELTKDWRVVEVTQNEDGTSTIEFDVRIKKTADLAAFTKAIERSLDTASSQIEFTKPKA
jgi:hypothetical protein